MTRTRTLTIIGCFMLALAVIAALELRTETSPETKGQMVTGALSKTSDQPIAPAAPAPSTPAAVLPTPETPARTGGALLPLDNGTLRPLPPFSPQPVPLQSTENLRQTAQVDSRPTADTARNELSPLPGSGPDRPAAPAPLITLPSTSNVPSAVVSPVETPASGQTPPSPSVVEPRDQNRPTTTVANQPTDKKNPAPAARPEPSKPVKSGEKPRIITTSAPEKLSPGQKAVIWTHLELSGSNIIFRLTGAQALEGKGFQLTSPNRYVVDLSGNWGITLPKVPNNSLLRSIRAGRQGKNTRLVFDLKQKPANCQIIRSNPKTLEIRLR